jgi:hypothetical protein
MLRLFMNAQDMGVPRTCQASSERARRQDAENMAVGERGERSIPVYGKNHPVRSSGAFARKTFE